MTNQRAVVPRAYWDSACCVDLVFPIARMAIHRLPERGRGRTAFHQCDAGFRGRPPARLHANHLLHTARAALEDRRDMFAMFREVVLHARGAMPDARATAPGARPMLPYSRAMVPDARAMVPDARAMVPDARGIVPDARAMVPDGRAMVPGHRAALRGSAAGLRVCMANLCELGAERGVGRALQVIDMAMRCDAMATLGIPSPRCEAQAPYRCKEPALPVGVSHCCDGVP
jgi:hypothetical protein